MAGIDERRFFEMAEFEISLIVDSREPGDSETVVDDYARIAQKIDFRCEPSPVIAFSIFYFTK